MKFALAIMLLCGVLLCSTALGASSMNEQLRRATWHSDPCLAWIVDHEDGSWDPTVDYGGGHGNVRESYGLPQANPGTKMASAGRDWRTNARTQLRWMRGYVLKYGGSCAAKSYWIRHQAY